MIELNSYPKGVVKLPPSKSYSHRAIICAALANGKSVIKNIAYSKDILATLNCIEQLGVKYEKHEGELVIYGGIDTNSSKTLNCCESGSTIRFMIPIASTTGQEVKLVGEGRLLSRPYDTFIKAFENTEVDFCKKEDEIVVSGKLKGGQYYIEGNVSSQFLTGFLFALPLVNEDSEIILTTQLESKGYIDMTLKVIEEFGVTIEHDSYKKFYIKKESKYCPCEYTIEADFSQSAYFLGAAALGKEVWSAGLNVESLQGDGEILEVLEKMGAEIITNEKGEIFVKADELNAIELDISEIPDLFPPIASILSFAKGKSKIYNASRLRIKESDRLHAMACELSKLGVKLKEGEDYLEIEGTEFLGNENDEVTVDSHNDHRIAMSMALASIKYKGKMKLTGEEAVNKSYPNFWEDWFKTKEE